MVDMLRKNGIPVWWLLAKDEGHGFRKKKNPDYQFYAMVMFVKHYLQVGLRNRRGLLVRRS